MRHSLLLQRRFLPLFLTQALGALDDNLFKNALVVHAVFRGADSGAVLAASAGGVFILPYLLFSSLAGQLADKFDKARLIRLNKTAEAILMVLGALAFLTDSVPLLFAVLAGLGVQAAFFGPLKYGLLPERLAGPELLAGNALIEAGTFIAILAGTIGGGLLIGGRGGPATVGACGVAAATIGVLTAWLIPLGRGAAPAARIEANLIAGTRVLLRAAREDRVSWAAILGISWFWAIGATFLTEFPVLAKTVFHADNQVVTLLLTVFVAGVGGGSMLAGRLGSTRQVPPSLLALGGCAGGFAMLAAVPAAGSWTTPAAMVGSPLGALALLFLFGTAGAGGMVSVPLYTLIQRRAPPGSRARTVAANNVMNAAFMVAGAVAIAGLSTAHVGPCTVLALAAALNLPAAALLRRALLQVRATGIASLPRPGP